MICNQTPVSASAIADSAQAAAAFKVIGALLKSFSVFLRNVHATWMGSADFSAARLLVLPADLVFALPEGIPELEGPPKEADVSTKP